MTIRVTIEVPDAKIGKLLSLLSGYRALCEHVPVEQEPGGKKANGKVTRRTGDAALMLTGKEAQAGTIRDKALKAFMKLEKKHGPGGVTRSMFRAEINKLGADASTLNSLITAGLIKHVEDK